eukprot:5809019-Pyramimonas_sp.AAC.1
MQNGVWLPKWNSMCGNVALPDAGVWRSCLLQGICWRRKLMSEVSDQDERIGTSSPATPRQNARRELTRRSRADDP